MDAQVDGFANLPRSSLEPAPLRIPPRAEAKSPTFFSDVESSVGDYDTSNEDPFKYDNERYQKFLRPTKERDVSQALKRLSRLDQASEGTLITPDGSPRGKTGANESPEFDKQQSRDAAARFLCGENNEHSGPGVLPHDTGPKIEFPDTRVVIQHASDIEPTQNERQDKLSELANKHLFIHTRDDRDIPRDTTNDSGWVTEATSDIGSGADIGSDPPFPMMGFKQAGSSIADYSDEEDHINKRRGPFTSREHILQHPQSEAQSTPYELRNLKDTKQQVLLPRTRARDAIGFPQNSIRLFSTKSKDTESAPRRPSSIRNPFRQGNYRRADSSSHFQFMPRGNGPSKYEFRDSASEYSQVMDSNQATRGSLNPQQSSERSEQDKAGGITIGFTITNKDREAKAKASDNASQLARLVSLQDAQAAQKLARENGLLDETLLSNYRRRRPRDLDLDKKFAMGTPSTFDNEPASACSFEFELLPLGKAQAKLKQQRDSGETDETEPGDTRFKRVKSETSTQAWSPPSPPRPPAGACLRGDNHGKKSPSFSLIPRESSGVAQGNI